MLTALSFSSIADAANATSRLYGVFEAELLEKTHTVDPTLDVAIEVKGASFTWDSLPLDADEGKPGKKSTTGGRMMQSSKSRAKAKAFAAAAEKKRTDDIDEKAKNEEERVFKLQDISMTVPRGQLAAIVGPVGSGKTSLLQGLIGEMRKTDGSIVFGGSVGYCPQSAWIQVRSILGYDLLG
jgi:ABC-type glutathione transport system ATPase component